jgi:formylglycine-generating enzyme required for sulfatase activity
VRSRLAIRVHHDRERGLSPPASPSRSGVLVASAGLVLAVTLALVVSRRSTQAGIDDAQPSVALPERLEGFRPELWYLPDDSMLGFVEIPAGPFTMGSDPGQDSLAFDIEWWGEGRVQGTVTLPTFYLARTEVTVAQYAAFVNDAAYPVLDPRALRAPPGHPVTHVAWTDAVAYARWLDGALREPSGQDAGPLRETGIPGLLDAGYHVALPSEAEWEKAARGTDGRVYPWGGEPRRDRANYRARATVAVGSFDCPECPYPVLDMSGNVWEWTRSPYRPYPFDVTEEAIELGVDALWVMRGGSFGDPEPFIRAANRGGADPGARRPFIGFRVALVPR